MTNVRFNHDDTQLLSTGGGDCSILFWTRPVEDCDGGDDSDDDAEDACYDSDVDEELSIDYNKQTNFNNQRDQAREQAVPEENNEIEIDFKSRGAEKTCLAEVSDRYIMNLKIDHVFGYRGYDARSNADFFVPASGPTTSNEVIYHAAGVCIIHDSSTGQQRFYTQHSDDVLCLANNRHPSYRSTVASGQLGGHVHVWSSETLEPLSLLSGLPGGVSSVSFSGSGRLLVAACLDQDHTLSVYRWQTGALVASKITGPNRIFQAVFRPDSDSKFVTVGERSLFFWNVAGSVLLGKKAQLPSSIIAEIGGTSTNTYLSLAFGTPQLTFTGMSTGHVIVWSEQQAIRVVKRAHSGPVFAMFTTLTDGLIVTGGKERSGKSSVKLWDAQMAKNKHFTIPVKNDATTNNMTVKSVSRVKGRICFGTR